MRNQKGVSLITLIITIIVVIILAIIILRSGASDAPTQAQFSGFTSEMGDLQDAVRAAMLTAKGSEATKGNNRSDAQLYNFIARGGYNVLTEKSGDSMWLVQDDAEKIPCTLINKTWAEDSIGTKLPVRKVETTSGTNQEMTYFVTPKGNVFCWPPYVYDGKSYVNADTVVKKGTAVNASGDVVLGTTDFADVEATAKQETGKDVIIAFANGEYVKVGTDKANEDQDYTRREGYGEDAHYGVWYYEDGRNLTVPAHRGVAAGYVFGLESDAEPTQIYFNNKG